MGDNSIGQFLLVIGIFQLRPLLQARFVQDKENLNSREVVWVKYSEAELSKAKAAGKPVIVDFHADWCVACKELDQYTFSKPRFQLLAKNFVLLKYDATAESPELEALRTKYEIVGLPTVLFFNSRGELIKELTLTSFEEVDPFVARMTRAMQ